MSEAQVLYQSAAVALHAFNAALHRAALAGVELRPAIFSSAIGDQVCWRVELIAPTQPKVDQPR